MIGTEKLELIIELALWSGCLENERPLSLLIVAKPESGKSELVLKYKDNIPNVWVLTDATAFGLLKILKEDAFRAVRHIIIPDLLSPLSRQPATVHSFIAFMNNLIEEGVMEIQTGFMTFKETGLNIGLISTMTPSVLQDRRHGWSRIGFLSRMVPVSYKYSQQTAQKILVSITHQEYHKEKPKALTLPTETAKVALPPRLAKKMLSFTRQHAQAEAELNRVEMYEGLRMLHEAEELYGFRYQKQLQVMLKSRALMKGREEVTQEDVDALGSLLNLIGTRELEI